MAQSPLPQPPREFERQGREVYLWFRQIYKRISDAAQIAWTQLDLTGSSLSDLTTRPHSQLQSIGLSDDTDTDATQDKHISNLQAKTWTDNDAKAADDTDTDATFDKHVSNAKAKAWTDTKTAYDLHAAASNAHGATGNILGAGNTASAGTRGPVYQAAANTDPSASAVSGSTSAVSVTSADISAAPATYNATWGGEVVTLGNELKADLNTLVSDVNTLAGDLDSVVTDLNLAITALNNLQSKMRTAEQLAT